MKKIQTFIYVLLMGFAFAACQDDSLGGTEQGGIRIALTDGTVGVDVTTRSTPSELFDGFKQKFKFQIKGGDNYDQTYDWTDEVIPLAAGVYDITATCGTEQADSVVQFDKPCYTGTKEGLKVNAGETATTAEISCKVTNALVSIQFDDEYKEYITDATYAMIAVESGTETNWADLSTSAYFKAGSSITQLKLYKDGTESTYADILAEAKKNSNFPETFAAGDHLILTLSIAKANGNAAIKVSKVEVKKVTIEETIPLEWLPAPKIGYFNNQENVTSIEYTETADAIPAVLNFSGSMDIQDVEFSFEFGDKQEQFQALNSKTFTFSTLTEEDKTLLETANVELPSFSGNTGTWSLNDMTAHLQVAEGSSTENKIKLRVKANERWSSEEGKPSVYTIKTVAPKITVTAKEEDIWSKTITISGATIETGNEAVIKDNLKYQFYENGGWKDCQDLVAAMENHPSDGKMQIRAVYRDVIECEPTTFDLETPMQLPNSDMDDWSIETLSKTSSYYHYNPYLEADSNPWWATNNDRAADPPVAAVEANSCPSVSYVTGRNGSRAAELRTTAGSHYAHTNSFLFIPAVLYPEGIVPGMLFIGNYAWNDHEEEVITPGHTFEVRPTDLEFYYKYQPLNTDEFKAYVEVLNQSTVIASGTFSKSTNSSDSDFQLGTIHLEYTREDLKATHIYVHFWSTTKTSFSESDVIKDATVNLVDVSNDWKAHVGSRLQIDDIQLIYDK